MCTFDRAECKDGSVLAAGGAAIRGSLPSRPSRVFSSDRHVDGSLQAVLAPAPVDSGA